MREIQSGARAASWPGGWDRLARQLDEQQCFVEACAIGADGWPDSFRGAELANCGYRAKNGLVANLDFKLRARFGAIFRVTSSAITTPPGGTASEQPITYLANVDETVYGITASLACRAREMAAQALCDRSD